MSLEIYVPRGILADYVHMFWSWENYSPDHDKERILPHGSMELTINLADQPLITRYPEDAYKAHSITGPLLAGVRANFFVIDTSQPADLLSVYFKVGASPVFFNLSAAELSNMHITLETLWGSEAINLYHRLLETPNTQRRFQILEMALLKRLIEPKTQHQAVTYALRVFQQNYLSQTIADVSHQIGISQTRFIQVFRETVGLTPKKFTRIQRFRLLLNMIAQDHSPNWADMAVRCGYFDQAHLINEFRTLAGITPTTYVPQDVEHLFNLPYFD